MESLLPEYSAFGAVREAAGSALPGIAPSNAYRCSDGYVLIAGNGDSIFKRLMTAIGRDDLGNAPDLANNAGRVARVAELDAAIGAWTRRAPSTRCSRCWARRTRAGRHASTPRSDIADDPHYRARDMILRQHDARRLRASTCPASCPSSRARPARSARRAPRSATTPTRCCAKRASPAPTSPRCADNKVIVT